LCYVGAIAQTRGRAVTANDYEISDNGRFVLTHSSRAVKVNTHKVTKADKRALKAAFAQADYSDATGTAYLNVAIGDFIVNRNRFIDSDMIVWDDNDRPRLVEHSRRIK
jgi:hypothetical protein